MVTVCRFASARRDPDSQPPADQCGSRATSSAAVEPASVRSRTVTISARPMSSHESDTAAARPKERLHRSSSYKTPLTSSMPADPPPKRSAAASSCAAQPRGESAPERPVDDREDGDDRHVHEHPREAQRAVRAGSLVERVGEPLVHVGHLVKGQEREHRSHPEPAHTLPAIRRGEADRGEEERRAQEEQDLRSAGEVQLLVGVEQRHDRARAADPVEDLRRERPEDQRGDADPHDARHQGDREARRDRAPRARRFRRRFRRHGGGEALCLHSLCFDGSRVALNPFCPAARSQGSEVGSSPAATMEA